MNRPLVWVALAFLTGVVLGSYDFFPSFWPGLLICAGGVLCAVVPRFPLDRRAAGILLCFLGGGALWWDVRHFGPPGDPLSRFLARHPQKTCVLEGRVRDPKPAWSNSTYLSFVLDVEQMVLEDETLSLSGRTAVRWKSHVKRVYAGERVRVHGEPTLALSHVNPGLFGIEDYYRRIGVHSAVRAYGPQAVERIAPVHWWSPTYWASRLRTVQADRFANVMPESVLPFVLAVWLGDRSQVPDEEYRSYVISGTAHILSVSGVHVGIIFVTASFALSLVVKDRRWRALCIMAVVVLFALTAGARPAVVRATLMVIVYLAADVLQREPDPPTALAIAAVCLLVGNPDTLFNLSFMLSFLSVASILVFEPRIRAWIYDAPGAVRRGRFILRTFSTLGVPLSVGSQLTSKRWFWSFQNLFVHLVSVSLAAQLLPFPASVRYFHVLSLAAPLTNMIVVPLTGLALWLCALTSASLLVSSHLASLFGHALAPVVDAIHWVRESVASTHHSHLALTSPTAFAMICYWGGILALAGTPVIPRRSARFALAAALFAAMAIGWSPLRLQPMVAFLDVGHGDAAFIRSPGGSTVLIDGGSANEFRDVGAQIIAPFLWANHVKRLDHVVVSHTDIDHIGGLFHVVETFPVGEVLMPGVAIDKPEEMAFLALCMKQNVPVRRLYRGDAVALDGALLEVLHPPKGWDPGDSDNDGCLVLRMEWDGVRVLFTGDIETRAEKQIAMFDCHADVLKAPHHGSKTSSSERFLDAVGPQHCMVSTGELSGRDIVSPIVLERYAERDIVVWRTDVLGGVSILERNGRPVLQAERLERHYPVPEVCLK